MHIALGRASFGWAVLAFVIVELFFQFFHADEWSLLTQFFIIVFVTIMYALGSAFYSNVIPADE